MANNEHLVEVLCAIKFDPSQNEWDSTFFGKYHEIIEKRGFTEKKEQKQIEFDVEVSPAQHPSNIKEGKSQIQMIFSNPTQKSAIILKENFISFHKLAPYSNWDTLIAEIVNPALLEYRSLGVGKGIVEVQCLYLNKYVIEKDKTISEYLTFLPIIPNSREAQVVFQGKYDLDQNNSVQLKLQMNANNPSVKEAFFECSSFANALSPTEDFMVLAKKAHDNANSIYKLIINPQKHANN